MVFGNCGVLQEMSADKGYVEMTGIDAETSQDIAEVREGLKSPQALKYYYNNNHDISQSIGLSPKRYLSLPWIAPVHLITTTDLGLEGQLFLGSYIVPVN